MSITPERPDPSYQAQDRAEERAACIAIVETMFDKCRDRLLEILDEDGDDEPEQELYENACALCADLIEQIQARGKP